MLNPGNFQQRRSKFAIDHHPLRSDVFFHLVTLVIQSQYSLQIAPVTVANVSLWMHHPCIPENFWLTSCCTTIRHDTNIKWAPSSFNKSTNRGYHQPPINHFAGPQPYKSPHPHFRIITHQPKGGFVLWISGKHVVLQKDVKLHRPHCSCRHKNGWDGMDICARV